jgi:glycosyltransferase involved in cell wall biosynthesis
MTDMSSPPLVSIVTPVYNGAEFLGECITSVKEQSYSHWDYTILDNCSTDGSFEVAKKCADGDSRIRVIRCEDFVPQLRNFNRLLGFISSDSMYTKFVLADDWLFPNCVDEMVKVAQRGSNVGIVGSYSLYRRWVSHTGLPYSRSPIVEGREASRQYLMTNDWFLGSPTCVMYRSDLVRERSSFFNERNRLCPDAEIALELMRTVDFGFVFQVLTFNRRDSDSVWKRQETFNPMLLQGLLMVYKFGPSVLDAAEYRQRVSELEREYYRYLASAVLRRPGDKFWEFQRNAWSAFDLTIDDRRVRRETAKVVLDALANPGRSWTALRRGLRWRL